MANLISWINIAVVFGSIVLFGAVGETLTEKAGNLNLGTPGIMCMGGAFGFVGAYLYETSVDGALLAMEKLEKEGYAFVTIDELAKLKNIELKKEKSYYQINN